MKSIEVVAAIIFDGEKILATQRGYGEFKGAWEFPGGKIETGEEKEEALLREIKEELAIEISIDSFLATIEFDYPKFHLIMHNYICHIEKGHVKLLEHDACQWLLKSELEKLQWLPADIEVVQKLLARA